LRVGVDSKKAQTDSHGWFQSFHICS
jgi:hypothetical protein